MTHLDEARYGRACLLVLNVCPFTLRHVIDDYYAKQGSPDIQDFLKKNKHNLYHIMTKKCCCRLIQSCVTPMYRSQWDLLFTKNRLPCRGTCLTGGECPCKFDPIPGITSNEMDITLCCLLIKNICQWPGINMTHIDTIRNIRNNLIHASSATLDVSTYNGYWSDVKTAILDLAKSVSPIVQTDTAKMIQDLETRIMDRNQLEELSKVIVNQKKVEERVSKGEKDLEKTNQSVALIQENVNQVFENVNQLEGNVNQLEGNVNQLEGDVNQLEKNVNTIKGNVSQLEGNMSHIKQNVNKFEENTNKLESNVNQRFSHLEEGVSQTTTKLTKLGETFDLTAESSKRKISEIEGEIGEQDRTIKQIQHQLYSRWDEVSADKEPDIIGLKNKLKKINNNVTKSISLSPLQERGKDELPIELLFAQVIIREDHTYREKGEKFAEQKREVKGPDDIFMMNGEEVRKVYMLGDAAHGKTTYCIWLVRNWCNAQCGMSTGSKNLDKWEKALKRFDFVFLLQFRHVSPDLACVTDMICKDVFAEDEDYWDTIRYVLSSNKYRSLIIMDGLDEWNPSEQVRKQLKCRGMPNLHMSSTVSSFYTMRPWVFSLISKLVKVSDRVIEIHGLSDKGMEQAIENVLLNHYELKDDRPKFELTYNKIVQQLNKRSLKSFMQIPLLAIMCVQLWYEEKQVGESLTSFYAAMIDMLIERAHEKHQFQIVYDNPSKCALPDFLSEYEYIKRFTSVLFKLGKVAYEGLFSNETKLVFKKRKLEIEVGVRELQIALKVGLISQKEAPSLLTKNVSVHFFHKLIQEFLAAIYIVTRKEVGDSFYKHLSNVNVITELSNVIMFICGMCPSLGSVISERVVNVTDSDTEILKYRQFLIGSTDRVIELNSLQITMTNGDKTICRKRETVFGNSTVEGLYRLQVRWYRELQDRQTDNPVTFHVSDVYVYFHDIEIVRSTNDILSDEHVADIRSLYLLRIPNDGEDGIADTVLNNFLCNKYNNTRSLVTIIIDGVTDRFISPMCIPSLRYLHLSNVRINNTHPDRSVCPSLLIHLESLHVLELCNVNLSGSALDISNMASLRGLQLSDVTLDNRVLDLSNMTSLRDLWLSNLTLYDKGLDLSNMTSLRELQMSDLTLGDRGLVLSNMTSLRDLWLSNLTLDVKGLELSNMTSLRELKMTNVTLGDRGLVLSNMKSLRELCLSCLMLDGNGLDLSDVTSLHKLQLVSVTLGDRGLDLTSMASLQVLRLEKITFGDNGLVLTDLTSLHTLQMVSVTLGYTGLDLSDTTLLRELVMIDVTLGERGLDLSGMTSLQVLSLASMNLGDRGLDLSDVTSLQVLRLEKMTLGYKGLDLSEMTSLQDLVLIDVILGKRGLDLSENSCLRELWLSCVALGARGFTLSANLVIIQKVNLHGLDMSSTQWKQFIHSVLNIQHSFHFDLYGTNIDDESITRIRFSPHFNVTHDGFDKYGVYKFNFKRIWPTPQVDVGNKILYKR